MRAPFDKDEGDLPFTYSTNERGRSSPDFFFVDNRSVDVEDLSPEELMELHGLAARAARKAGAKEDAYDIAQDTFAKLEGRDLDDIDNLEAWVQRVAKNAAIDLVRRAKHIEGPYDDDLGLEPQSFTTKFVSRQKIDDLVAALPPKYLAVIQLYYFQGLAADEIGARLGYATATVHNMLADGRSMLRPYITPPPGYER